MLLLLLHLPSPPFTLHPSTLPPFHPSLSPQDEVRSEPYFSPGHKTHFPQITLPIFPNSIFLFVVGYLFLYARGLMAARPPSPSMYKCVRFTRVHIAVFVPEKEMMYAELNGVFHRSRSVSGTLVLLAGLSLLSRLSINYPTPPSDSALAPTL